MVLGGGCRGRSLGPTPARALHDPGTAFTASPSLLSFPWRDVGPTLPDCQILPRHIFTTRAWRKQRTHSSPWRVFRLLSDEAWQKFRSFGSFRLVSKSLSIVRADAEPPPFWTDFMDEDGRIACCVSQRPDRKKDGGRW